MDHEVPYLVHQLYGNPDQNLRKEAEIRLYEIMTIAPDIAIQSIIPNIVDMNKPLHLRQLFLILLNQQIQRYCQWNSILTVSKQLTIELAFNGCYTSENVIRKPSMVLISTILSRGDDNERMMILNMLIYSLNQQSDQVLTHGSHPLTHSLTYSLNQQTKFNFMLKCLVVIVDNEIDSRLLIQLIEICYPKIFETFSSLAGTTGYQANRDLQYLSKLMSISMQKLENIQLQEGNLYNSHIGILSSFLTTWACLSTSYLSILSSSNAINNTIAEPGGLIQTVESISIGIQSFPQHFKPNFDTIITSSLTCLYLVKETYLSSTLTTLSAGEVWSSGYSSDGDRIDVEILVINLLELLNILYTLCQEVSISPDDLLTGNLDKLLDILIDYMQMTAPMVNCWNNDGNLYVSSEEDLDNSNDFSLRYIGANLLKSTCSYFKSKVFNYLFSNISHQWQQLQQNTTGYNENIRILHIEKLLWSLGFIGKSYMKYYLRVHSRSASPTVTICQQKIDEAVTITTDIPVAAINQLLGSMCQCLFTSQTPAILRSRMVWLINIFTLLLDAPMIISSISCSKELLENPRDPLSSKLLALRSLTGILFKFKSNTNLSTSLSVFAALNTEILIFSSLQLAPYLTDTTVHFLIEALTLLLEASPDTTNIKLLSDVGLFTSQTISQYYYDQFILDNLSSLVSSITSINYGIHAIETTIIPYFKSVLSGQITSLPSLFFTFATKIISKISILVGCSPATKYHLFHLLLEYFRIAPISYQSEIYNAIKTIISDRKSESFRNILLSASNTSLLVTLLTNICSTLSQVTEQAVESHADDDDGSDKDIENENPVSMLDCCYPIAGIITQLFCTVLDLLTDKNLILQLFIALFKCIEATTEVPIKSAMIMCVVNIFARSPAELVTVLNMLQQSCVPVTEGNIFYGFLHKWHQLHPLLQSRYNRVVSTMGLLNALQIMDNCSTNEQLSIKKSILNLILDTIPLLYDINYNNNSIKIAVEEPASKSEGNNILESIFNNAVGDDNDDEDDNDEDDSYGYENDEAFDDTADGSAATEIYLSDLLDVYANSNTKNNPMIADSLIFNNPTDDELFNFDIKACLITYAQSQNLEELITSHEHKVLMNFLQQL